MSSIKETILREATTLFARSGFERVTVRDIAKASDTTMPTLYHHFGDKQALYQAVVEQAFGTWTEEVIAALSDAPQSISDLLYRYFFTNFRQIADGTPHSRIVDRVLLDAAESDLEAEIAGRIAAPLNEIVNHAIEPIVPEEARGDIVYFMISLAYGAAKLLPIRHNLPDWKGGEDELDALSRKLAAIGTQFLLADSTINSTVSTEPNALDNREKITALSEENSRLKLLLGDAMLRIDNIQRATEKTT